MRKVLGVLEFTESLYCAADSLGKTTSISFAGIKGKLTLPSLPEFGENEAHPLNKPLLGPEPARTWKRGDELLYWGKPVSYPEVTASVELALLEFSLELDNYDASTQKIYNSSGEWLRIFEDYVKLITKQGTRNIVFSNDMPGNLELIFCEGAKFEPVSNNSSTYISVEMSSDDMSLHFDQYENAAKLASQFLQPGLQYRMLLESYGARKREDYRKAIIEAASALEVCLTMRIKEEFNAQGISFGEKLLQKFRMLGGRFELASLLGINLPDKDYKSLILNPRNNVIHRAEFPDKGLANQVINEVEELLYLLTPQLCEDGVIVQ
ncbi:hypothetical protein [Kangiella sp.]|uniref:hypothetical protein n=1 Tax=Kangiella sp. TaxID=1920245 RepID=UPI001983308D|nr:hypothetical protein [Kangiella sp.]MBD3653362.1 hypothetical protein [Kangiella sp.]